MYAVNIHTGGGSILLEKIVNESCWGIVSELFVDTRFDCNLIDKNIVIHRIRPTIRSRFLAEFKLKKRSAVLSSEEILFFGNLPPVFHLKNKSILFLQNAYLLKNITVNLSLKQKIRIYYERLLFYSFIKNVNKIIVQTDWMKNQLLSLISHDVEVKAIIPSLPKLTKLEEKKFDIISVTGSESHKNLPILISTLEKMEIELSVCIVANVQITINNKLIELTHCKVLGRDELFIAYQRSRALVVLSDFESFCLPLYEAKHFGLKLVAPIRGYITPEVQPDIPVIDLSEKGLLDALIESSKDKIICK